MNAVPLPDIPDGVVLYDGVCVLCSASFRFVAKRDPAARFRFTPVQGPYRRTLALRLGLDPEAPDSFAVVIDGTAYLRSDGAIQLLRRLPRWSWTTVLLAVPVRWRDAGYNLIARNRYKLFGRLDTCPVPSESLSRHVIRGVDGAA